MKRISTRKFVSMLVALFVTSGYGLSMLRGVLPLYPGVSWQSRLGGALGGIVAMWMSAGGRPRLAR